MRRVPIVVLGIAAAIAASFATLPAQQTGGPILLPPSAKSRAISATLLVLCDLACNWKLDGHAQGSIAAGDSATVKAGLGQHIVSAVTEDGKDSIEQMVEVKTAGQTAVSLKLQPIRDARLKTENAAEKPADQGTIPAPVTPAPAPAARTPSPATIAPSSIAVIEFQAAVTQTSEFQREFADLQKKFEPQRTHLKALSDEVDGLTKQLQGPGLSDADRATLSRTLDEKKKQLQREMDVAQKDFQQQTQALFEQVAQKVNVALGDIAKQQGLSMVIDATEDQQQQVPVLLYAANSTNITKYVVDSYNVKSGSAASAPAPSSGPFGPPKLAVIAFNTAVSNTNEFQREFAGVQAKFEPQKSQIKALNDEVDVLNKQLQAANLSAADRADLSRRIDEKKKQAQRVQEDAQNDFQQQVQEIYGKVAAKVYDVLSDYAGKNGYTLILDTSEKAAPKYAYTLPNMDIARLPSTDLTKIVTDTYNVKSGVPEQPQAH